MSSELIAQFEKTPWIFVRSERASIYCERCGGEFQFVNSNPDELIEFSKKHEECEGVKK